MSKFGEWIPITHRELSEEEKAEYEDYDEVPSHVFTCPLPDDGDEILISGGLGWVDLVVFCDGDYGVGDEDGNDWLNDVGAWMPLPEGYKKEENE